ncbi:hypothetical protein M758_10G130900 [Ceratodon purpureus]|nr:hypothetical protein M758_10G130900 [Ceratodon purpureus]
MISHRTSSRWRFSPRLISLSYLATVDVFVMVCRSVLRALRKKSLGGPMIYVGIRFIFVPASSVPLSLLMEIILDISRIIMRLFVTHRLRLIQHLLYDCIERSIMKSFGKGLCKLGFKILENR